MEPNDLSETEIEDAGADVRARRISLTPASAHTAKRGEAAEGGFSDRARGYSLLVTMGAIFISALWPAAMLAFLGALLGFTGLLALGPEWWVLIGAGAIFPIPVIWIAVITWNKTRDLSEEARRLALVTDRLIEPDQAAAHEIATIGLAIRREVDTLSSGVEVALEKVRSLEGAVAAQALAIEDVASGAEERAEQVRSRMEKERIALKEVADGLHDLTKSHEEEIEKHTGSMEEVAKRARTALDETTRHLDRQGQVLTQAVSSAVSDSQRVAESIELQVGELNKASDKALAMTDELAKHYGEYLGELTKTADGLGLENNRLEKTLSRQKELLAGVSELITNQNGQILTAIDGGVNHLDEALRRTVQAARSATEGLKGSIDHISENAQEAAADITKAAEKAGFVAADAQSQLDSEAVRVRKILETQSALARETMNALFAEFESMFSEKSGALSGLSAQEVASLRKEIETVRGSAQTALTEQADEARALIKEATDAVKIASTGLSEMFDKVITASEKSGTTFASTSSRVEEHMRTLPGLAEETTTRIRSVLDEELNAFAKLADESARKIRNLNQAYARHIPGAPKPNTWGEPHGGALGARPLSLETSGNPRPDLTKSDWAWGDVLAAVDRPFDDEHGGGAREDNAAMPDEAQAFSQSSLQIFEALQSMAVDLDRALETDPPRDLLRRYLNGERETFTKRLKEISSEDTANRIHDRYLEDLEFRHNVNQYIDQFENLLNEAMKNDSEELLIETFMSSNTGRVYFLLGRAIGHFG